MAVLLCGISLLSLGLLYFSMFLSVDFAGRFLWGVK